MSEHHYIFLLEQAHNLIRGQNIRNPHGMTTPDADALARGINNYLNTISSHGPGCWSWGPAHYVCACGRIKELENKIAKEA